MQDSISNGRVQRTPYSPHSPAHRKSGSTTSKLRDSCHACALSKVRCPKEKPTCSRCEKRGITCGYFVTKRPGRKRDNSQVANSTGACNTIRVTSSTLPDGRGTDLSTSNRSLGPPDLSPSSSGPSRLSAPAEFLSHMDVFADLLTPLEPSLFPGFSGMSNRFNDLLTPPIDFLDLESLDSNLSNFTQGHHDIADLLTSDDIGPDPFSGKSSLGYTIPSKPCSPASDGQALSTRGENACGASESGSMCCCMTQALDLMNRLFSPEPSSSTSLATSPRDAATISSTRVHSSNLSTQTVVAQNKQSIEAVSNMLQCPCGESGYLTTMLSMIVLKILERYAVAAREHPRGASFAGGESTLSSGRRNASTQEQMRQCSSYSSSPDDDGIRRMTAQLILSELHRVQGLVNQLALRLNALGVGEALGKGTNSERHSQVAPLLDGGGTTAAFSVTTLGQMKTDLRKCLTNLSSEIINMLRQS